MTFPVQPTVFAENFFRPEWQDEDFFHTQDGIAAFPDHHCKKTFVTSLPFAPEGGNAIDVGCRDGEYTRYLQQRYAHTYAFDARPRPFFAYNVDLGRVSHFTCGVSDRRETIQMFGGTHDPKNSKRHIVECYTLDAFGLTDISYIKIDVEGFEKRVLTGARATLERERPLVVIEQNDVTLAGEAPHAAKEWLEQELGYRVAAICPRGWDYIMVAR